MNDDLPMPSRQKVYLYLSGVFITALLIGDTIGSKLFVLQLPVIGEAPLSGGAMWLPISFVRTARLPRMIGVGYLLEMLVAVALPPVIYALHALIHRRFGLDDAPVEPAVGKQPAEAQAPV